MGGAFFDSDFEVVGHAHREVAEGVLGSEFGEPGEDGAGGFGYDEGGHGHETEEVEAVVLADFGDGGGEFSGREPVFAGFAGDVDLDIDGEALVLFGAVGLERFGEFDAVNGFDDVEGADNVRGFAALDVADHVPGEGQGGVGAFERGGVDAIFADMSDAKFGESVNFGIADGFGDGDELNGVGGASTSSGGIGDALAYTVEVSGNAIEISHGVVACNSTSLRRFQYSGLRLRKSFWLGRFEMTPCCACW